MKALPVISICLAVVAAGVSLYGLIETRPNYDYAWKMSNESEPGSRDFTLWDLLAENDFHRLTIQAVTTFFLAAIGIILAIISLMKKKLVPVAGISIGLGLLAIIFGIMIFP